MIFELVLPSPHRFYFLFFPDAGIHNIFLKIIDDDEVGGALCAWQAEAVNTSLLYSMGVSTPRFLWGRCTCRPVFFKRRVKAIFSNSFASLGYLPLRVLRNSRSLIVFSARGSFVTALSCVAVDWSTGCNVPLSFRWWRFLYPFLMPGCRRYGWLQYKESLLW